MSKKMYNKQLVELLEAADHVQCYIEETLHNVVEDHLLYTGVIEDTGDEGYVTINTVKKMVLTKLLKELEL